MKKRQIILHTKSNDKPVINDKLWVQFYWTTLHIPKCCPQPPYSSFSIQSFSQPLSFRGIFPFAYSGFGDSRLHMPGDELWSEEMDHDLKARVVLRNHLTGLKGRWGHQICQAVVSDNKKQEDQLNLIPIPKKGNAKERSNYCTIALISHTSKVTLKILQASPQQYVDQELPDVQVGFRKSRGTRDQIAKIHCIIEKAREFQKNIYFCFIDYTKAFDSVDHNKLWKILKEMGIPDHLTCILRNLYTGQEAIVRTRHGKMDWFQIGKGVHQGCILSPCLFNLHAEYIMRNAGLDATQAGIKTAGRTINNL